MRKAELCEDKTLMFFCPGCETHHGVPVDGSRGWKWNQSVEAPTVTPSIHVQWVKYDEVPPSPEHPDGFANVKNMVCHSYVTDGKIQFLTDCTHALNGQIVDLPDFDAVGR